MRKRDESHQRRDTPCPASAHYPSHSSDSDQNLEIEAVDSWRKVKHGLCGFVWLLPADRSQADGRRWLQPELPVAADVAGFLFSDCNRTALQ